MKLKFSIVLLVGVVVLFFMTKEKQPSSISSSKNNVKIIKLKMAHNLSQNSALHEASVLFASKVKEKTNNQVQIELYPSQKLGNDYKMVELARKGEIDILLTPTSKMSISMPSTQYADLPFLFPTREDAYSLLDGDVGKLILRDLNNIDLVGITFWENGFKHFTGNSQLREPSDFIDQKIRVMKSRIIMEQFNALGAVPIPIDFHATKKALLDKVVDGQENPLVAIVNMDFHKVQSHLTISEHAYLSYVFSLSKKSLLTLPIDIQHILTSTALEITPWQRAETIKREKRFLEIIKQENVQVYTLNQEEKNLFKEATKYIIKMYEDVIGSHIISKTEEYFYNKNKTDDMIVIGIDADLSMSERSSGLAIKRGVELAVDEINQNGGLLGKQVMIVSKDHQLVSTQGVKNIREFAKDSNVKVVIGGKHSSIIGSEIEYIQQEQLPFISPWASSMKIIDNGFKDNYLFRVSANNEDIMAALLDETFKEYTKPLVIVENSIWGRGAFETINKFALQKNLNSLDSLVINHGENNFTQVMEALEKNESDSIILVLNSKEGTKLVQTLAKKERFIPIISHWGIVGDEFFLTNKKYLSKFDLRFIQTFSFESKDKKIKKLAERYLSKYGKEEIRDILAPNGVAQAYDTMHLIALAIEQSKSLDRKIIKQNLEKIPLYEGIVKTYKYPFNKKDHEAFDKGDLFFAKYNSLGLIMSIEE